MYRIRTVFTGVAGSPWYSNLYFDPAEGDAPVSTAQAVAAFWEDLEGDIANNVSWSIDPSVPTIDPATGDTTDYTTVNVAGGQGTNLGVLLPIATQGLITLRTSATIRNRRLIGRIFVPGLCASTSGPDGEFTGTFADRMTTAANTLRTASSGGNVEALCVWSRPKGPSLEIPFQLPGSAHVVTGASGALKPAVLRSRRD